jgi:hypothetical protein
MSLYDDELYGLAQAAGYLPGPSTGGGMDQTEAVDPYGIPQSMPTPSVGPEETGLENVPSPMGGLEAPEFVPNSLLSPSPNVPELSGRMGMGMGMGTRGFSEKQYGKVSKTEVSLVADQQEADALAQQGAENMAAPAYSAAAGMRDAAAREAEARAKQIKAGGEQALVMQRLQDDFAVEEARINAEATAMSNQSKADYIAALADFRAAKVDPAQLWSNMSGGERFGMLATAFVHDFLGARGINTSAMATFNKAIDRNIDAQIQAIKTKGEVAEGFKSLWYMQRNQAASDTEARARVRGFLLEATKQQIVANMAQYESALASAQGQSAIAAIDKELSTTLVEIYKHADANALNLRNQALQKWEAKLRASIDQQNINLRAQELDLARKKQDAEHKAPSIEAIYDPESGDALWYYKPGITEAEKVKTRERLEGLAGLNRDFEELRELGRAAESIADPVARTRLAGTIQQKMDALSTRMAHNFAKANDERATDKDVADFLKGMKMKTWLNRGDVDQIIAFTHEQMIKPAYDRVQSVAFDMPKELIPQFGRSAQRTPFGGSLTDAHNAANPPQRTMDEIHEKAAGMGAAGVPGNEKIGIDAVGEPTRKAYKALGDQYGKHLFPQQYTAKGEPTHEIPRHVHSHIELRRLAAKARKEGTPDERNTALQKLQQLSGIHRGTNFDDPVEVSAAYALHTMYEEE